MDITDEQKKRLAEMQKHIDEHGLILPFSLDSPLDVLMAPDGALLLRSHIGQAGTSKAAAVGIGLTPAAVRDLKAAIARIERALGMPIEDIAKPNSIQ